MLIKSILRSLGFRKTGLKQSIVLALLTIGIVGIVHYSIFTSYLPSVLMGAPPITLNSILLYVLLSPLLEEFIFRSILLAVSTYLLGRFTRFNGSPFSIDGVSINLGQSILFMLSHYQYLEREMSLFLIPPFLLGFLNGVVFLKTKNIIGSIMAHSICNSIVLIIPTLLLYCSRG